MAVYVMSDLHGNYQLYELIFKAPNYEQVYFKVIPKMILKGTQAKLVSMKR